MIACVKYKASIHIKAYPHIWLCDFVIVSLILVFLFIFKSYTQKHYHVMYSINVLTFCCRAIPKKKTETIFTAHAMAPYDIPFINFHSIRMILIAKWTKSLYLNTHNISILIFDFFLGKIVFLIEYISFCISILFESDIFACSHIILSLFNSFFEFEMSIFLNTQQILLSKIRIWID